MGVRPVPKRRGTKRRGTKRRGTKRRGSVSTRRFLVAPCRKGAFCASFLLFAPFFAPFFAPLFCASAGKQISPCNKPITTNDLADTLRIDIIEKLHRSPSVNFECKDM